MPLKNPDISLIFVNYRSAKYLGDALKSLFLYEKNTSLEVIIINNDPSETELLKTLTAEYANTFLIESQENLGFGRAVNKAAKVARGEFLGLLNPDTLWTQRQLSEILVELKKEECIIGLSLLDVSGQQERYNFGRKVSLIQLFLNHLPRRKSDFQEKKCVDWVSGGALFLSKKLFWQLDGFDETYFLYYEDVDLCERARRQSIKIYVYRNFSLIHYRGKSQESIKKQKQAYYQSQAYYFRKMRPVYERWILRCIQVFL